MKGKFSWVQQRQFISDKLTRIRNVIWDKESTPKMSCSSTSYICLGSQAWFSRGYPGPSSQWPLHGDVWASWKHGSFFSKSLVKSCKTSKSPRYRSPIIKWITNTSPDSRRGTLYSTSLWQEWQRICSHLQSITVPCTTKPICRKVRKQ